MAQQTSATQRKQSTPRPIGRLTDADVSGPFFSCIEIRQTWPRRNGNCVTAVKERPIHDFKGLARGGRPLSRWKFPVAGAQP
jgi:hypothetical protein